MKNKLFNALPQQRDMSIQDGTVDHAVGIDEHFQQSDSLQIPSSQQSATISVYHYVPAASPLVCDSHCCGTADMNVQRNVSFKMHTGYVSMPLSYIRNNNVTKSICTMTYSKSFLFSPKKGLWNGKKLELYNNCVTIVV
jgi:hypothetical protein